MHKHHALLVRKRMTILMFPSLALDRNGEFEHLAVFEQQGHRLRALVMDHKAPSPLFVYYTAARRRQAHVRPRARESLGAEDV